jgi:hypothetical protein
MTKLLYVCGRPRAGLWYTPSGKYVLVKLRNEVSRPAEQKDSHIIFVCTPDFPVNRLPA